MYQRPAFEKSERRFFGRKRLPDRNTPKIATAVANRKKSLGSMSPGFDAFCTMPTNQRMGATLARSHNGIATNSVTPHLSSSRTASPLILRAARRTALGISCHHECRSANQLTLLNSGSRSKAAWSVCHRLAKGQATLSGTVFDPAPSALSACSVVLRQGDLLTNRTPVSIISLCKNSALTPSPDTRGQTSSLEVLQVCRSTLRARWVCTVFMPHIHCLRRSLQSWDPTKSNNLQQISRK